MKDSLEDVQITFRSGHTTTVNMSRDDFTLLFESFGAERFFTSRNEANCSISLDDVVMVELLK